MGSLLPTTEAPRFGKYSLVARLATGGMAEIFLARLHGAAGFEKLVCIKRILPHLARDKQFVGMFLDEARIASRISHPNVCQVFELGEIEGSYYIAMEYLEGVPLACFRQLDDARGRPAPRLVAGIAVQASEALHHTHQLKHSDGSVMEVVHRDISPQNLFVTVDGVVKVLDFGIAKIRDATVKTGTGAVKGTYAYMAPEQLRGERVDRRTDVFALGIVMWETLVGRYLFRRDTEFLTFQAITSDPIDDVSTLRPDVPPALSEVIRTALSRDREARFPTARMLGEAIAAALPPLAGSAISEFVTRSFPLELGEQAALIKVARAGGAFDLDIDRGPRVRSEDDDDFVSTSISDEHSARPRTGASAASQVSQVSVSASSPIPPPPRTGRISATAAIAAAAALVIAGGGALLYKLVGSGAHNGDQRADAGSGSAGRQIAAAGTAPGDAGQAALLFPDAGVPDVAPDVAPDAATDAAPNATDAATRTTKAVTPDANTTLDVPKPKHAAQRPDKPARPSGPPGTITIDSSPSYAVIFVDNRRMGDTPLVKLELPPGSHIVRAVTESGASQEKHIVINAGENASPCRFSW